MRNQWLLYPGVLTLVSLRLWCRPHFSGKQTPRENLEKSFSMKFYGQHGWGEKKWVWRMLWGRSVPRTAWALENHTGKRKFPSNHPNKAERPRLLYSWRDCHRCGLGWGGPEGLRTEVCPLPPFSLPRAVTPSLKRLYVGFHHSTPRVMARAAKKKIPESLTGLSSYLGLTIYWQQLDLELFCFLRLLAGEWLQSYISCGLQINKEDMDSEELFIDDWERLQEDTATEFKSQNLPWVLKSTKPSSQEIHRDPLCLTEPVSCRLASTRTLALIKWKDPKDNQVVGWGPLCQSQRTSHKFL